MAYAMQGLRLKPTYEQLIGVAVSDGLENVKFPNRNATFLRNGFILSQLDGEGARIMEDQQKRHIKEVYMDSAIRSLASEHGSDNGSVSNVSFKSAHTQNTAIARIDAMLTESINARKAVFFDLSENDMEPHLELESSSSSSDGQNYNRNHIHVDDYFNSIRDLKNESMLREMEVERRTKEIVENNARMFKEDLFRIHGENELHNIQQQGIIDSLLQIQSPYGPMRSEPKPKPLFPQDPQDSVMQQHLRAVEMTQQSRKPRGASSSSNEPESTHEKKGPVGRPRNVHGVPTENRTDPLYWQSQPIEFIRTQLSNRGWRVPHYQHLTTKGTIAKRLTKEHYLKELFYLLGDIDY